MNDVPIKDAATVILLRDHQDGPMVLMGQRGNKAVFMPNKFVFPGGGVDHADSQVSLLHRPQSTCLDRLAKDSDPALIDPLCLAAVREMWEETGHAMAKQDAAAALDSAKHPPEWREFYQNGWQPDASGLEFIFRAITPPGRPRRFDARFFLGHADLIMGDPDDFSNATDELSHLQWIPLAKSREFDLPFITEIVLAEVQSRISNPDKDHPVPFFFHDGDRSQFLKL